MTQSAFDAFYQQVLWDARLQAQLMPILERDAFVAQVVALGAAHGYRFDAATVVMALQRQRRAWIERWIR